MHDVVHKKQLNLLIFKIITNYDLKVLKEIQCTLSQQNSNWFFDVKKKTAPTTSHKKNTAPV